MSLVYRLCRLNLPPEPWNLGVPVVDEKTFLARPWHRIWHAILRRETDSDHETYM